MAHGAVSCSGDYPEVFGQHIPGPATARELTAILDAAERLRLAQEFGPHIDVPALLDTLVDAPLWKRVQALRELARRGPAARQALPHLGEVLEGRHSAQRCWVTERGGMAVGEVDATAEVHRAAAEAILRIAPEEHLLAARARGAGRRTEGQVTHRRRARQGALA